MRRARGDALDQPLGWAVGAAAGALVIGVDSRPAYVALLVLNAATFLAYAALVAERAARAPVPRTPARPRPAASCATAPT